jgi:hypothetical protein
MNKRVRFHQGRPARVPAPRRNCRPKASQCPSVSNHRKRGWSFGDQNAKLGAGILSWSIVPMLSCPGASAICKGIVPDGRAVPKPRCYGFRGRFAQPMFHLCYQRHFEFSKSPDFAAEVIEALLRRRDRVLAFRINDLGDFYDLAYVQAWINIVRACPEIKF